MSETYLINGLVYTNQKFVEKTIRMKDGLLTLIPSDTQIPEAASYMDIKGKKIVPGFIDIHTHGAGGYDVNAASAEEFELICRTVARYGTTSWLASILTDTKEQTLSCINQYNLHKKLERKGANLIGIHLEGPFLCSLYKGAMPEHLLKMPDMELLEMYQKSANGEIRYITISPEIDGIIDDIPKMIDLGMTVSIGHSGADYETSMMAIENGANSCTHTFNAMKLLHQHSPSIMGAVLESDIYCEAICDGRHLHPGVVRLLIKTKGLDRVIAISDSIMAAGLPDGNYKLGVNDVIVKDGDAKLASDGTRAGSTLTQNVALKNLLDFTGKTLEEIIPLLTENPAKLIHLYDRKGSIENGKDADLVVLDENNDIFAVFIDGYEFKY